MLAARRIVLGNYFGSLQLALPNLKQLVVGHALRWQATIQQVESLGSLETMALTEIDDNSYHDFGHTAMVSKSK